MPVPGSQQRHSRPNSPPTYATETTTPLRPRLSAVFNTPSLGPSSGTSYSPTVTQGAHSQPQKLSVTRVAIEGKANRDEEVVNIKMYLKISVPVDSVTPGSTIPLFAEENVKILSSQLHPLDNNSIPYNFSSELSPLLHHAARALGLPARSSESYYTAYGLSPPTTADSVNGSVRSSKTNGASSSGSKSAIPPVDPKYTGHILVNSYNISFVLPKAFPTRYQESDQPRSSSSARRSSIMERNSAHFMAAIDMLVPYVSRPPRSPFLLSIPTPRCLQNNIRLRIFAPKPASNSYASLSSVEEEGGSWDLTSEPHVTRMPSSRHSRSGTHSYGNVADDESSDSSTTGFSDGCGIQGTFPSAERIRVRWAKPQIAVGDSGRRRVGVKDVKGEMTCAVLGRKWDSERQQEGILLHVDYKGTCKGVWFPGVATMLGMDVSLEAKGSDLSWLPGTPNGWDVGGGTGYTGFDVGAPAKPDGPSRHDSLESNFSNGPQPFLTAERNISRQSSASSSSSLLRSSLPVNNVPEYSFEGSGTPSMSTSQTTSIESSVGSLPSSDATNDSTPRPPGVPVTIHVDMNKLILPASKNVFSFSISGTVLVTPRPRVPPGSATSRNSSPVRAEPELDAQTPPIDPESIVVPRFTVLAADNEAVSIIVRNDLEMGSSATVEVTTRTPSTESHQRGTSPGKTILQRSDYVKCSEHARIAVKPGIVFASTSANGMPATNGKLHPPSRPRTPTGRERVSSTTGTSRAMSLLGMAPARPKRDGALMIPSVRADVTPLVVAPERKGDSSRLAALPAAYAVRVCLAAPADTESEWLEFGFAKHVAAAESGSKTATLVTADNVTNNGPPKVDIVSVSVDDVPVLYEANVAVKQEEPAGVGLPFEQIGGQDWLSWVKLRVGAVGGGRVVVDYVVKDFDETTTDRKGKAKAKERTQLDIYLPTFSLPVGRLEVNIDEIPGLEVSRLRSNFLHSQHQASGRKLLHYSLQPFFYPHISLDLRPDQSPPRHIMTFLLLYPFLAFGFVLLLRMNTRVSALSNSLEECALSVGSGWHNRPEPITVTSTAFVASRWPWFNGDVQSDVPPEPPQPSLDSSTVVSVVLTVPPTTPTTPSVVEVSRVLSTITIKPSTSVAVFRPLPFNFTWPEIDVDLVMEKLSEGAEKVWQLLRRIYHYPLDPP